MDDDARRALATVRRCLASERYLLLPHFLQRMDERGMVWPDVVAVIDELASVVPDGVDDWGRPRWIIAGDAPDGLSLGVVCVIGRNAADVVTVFITLFWKG